MTQPNQANIQYAAPAIQRTASLAATQFIFCILALSSAAALVVLPFFVRGISKDEILVTFRVAALAISVWLFFTRNSKVLLGASIYVAIAAVATGPISAIASSRGGMLVVIYCLLWSFWGIFLLSAAVCGFHRLERLSQS